MVISMSSLIQTHHSMRPSSNLTQKLARTVILLAVLLFSISNLFAQPAWETGYPSVTNITAANCQYNINLKKCG